MTRCARSTTRTTPTPDSSAAGAAANQASPPPMSNNEISRRVDEFLVANGARVRVNDAGARARPDHRVQQPDVRYRQGGADRGDAQRGLRPHRPHPRRRHAGGARVHDREHGLSGRADGLQRDRRDSRHRQEGRGRHARRPPRLVALRDRRDRQRDRVRDDDGGGADSEGDRRHAAADHSRRALERRRAGDPRIAGAT